MILGDLDLAESRIDTFEASHGFSFAATSWRVALLHQRSGATAARDYIDKLLAHSPPLIAEMVLRALMVSVSELSTVPRLEAAVTELLPYGRVRRDLTEQVRDLIASTALPAPFITSSITRAAATFAALQCLTLVDAFLVGRKTIHALAAQRDGTDTRTLLRVAGIFARATSDSSMSLVPSLLRGESLDELVPEEVLRLIDSYTTAEYDQLHPLELFQHQVSHRHLPLALLAGRAAARRASSGFAAPWPSELPGILGPAFVAGASAITSPLDLTQARRLEHLSLVFSVADTGACLAALSQQLGATRSARSVERALLLATGYTSPRGLAVLDVSGNSLLGLAERSPASSTTALFRYDPTVGPEQAAALLRIPRPRVLRHAATKAFERNELVLAQTLAADLAAIAEAPVDKSAALELLLDVHCQAEQWDSALDVLGRAHALHNLPIETPQTLAQNANRLRNIVSSPAVALGWYQAMQARPSELRRTAHFAIAQCLRSTGVRTPSQIRQPADSAQRLLLAHFLMKVCILPNIDSIPHIARSSQELLLERIAICQLVARLSSALAEAAENEIAALESKLQVERALESRNRGRLTVNAEGIRRELGQDFARELEQILLIGKLKAHVYILSHSALESELRAVASSSIWGTEQFEGLLSRFRDVFLRSNDYGLELSLSGEIRHGAIANELRHSLDESGLLTAREGGRYPFPPDFESAFATTERSAADEAYQEFAHAIDGIFRAFVEERIHTVVTPAEREKRPYALFSFATDQQSVSQWFDRLVTSGMSADASIDYLFALLWQQVSMGCAAVRHSLQSDVRASVLTALSSLRAHWSPLMTADGSATLEDRIARAETGLEYSLATVAAWFAPVSGDTLDSFTPAVLADAVVASVSRLHSLPSWQPRVSVAPDVQFVGRDFPPLFRALHILLQNAVQHARATLPSLEISILHDGEGRLRFAVTHERPPELAVETLIETFRRYLELVRAGGRRVREEGGSGVLKLATLLRVDLKMPLAAPRFDVTADRVSASFYVETRASTWPAKESA